MTAFVPPAPRVHPRDISILRFLATIGQSSLEIWPDYAFDIAFNYRKWMGIESALVNNPEGIRHVLLTNAANYRRPAGVRRVALPLGGNGLFLAEGADWRRQRRIMAPPFTPASIALLLPHFHEAAAHLLRSVSNKRANNLSAAFQDTALEAVLRALFSLPESPLRREIAQMARHYIEGAGRPSVLDGFARGDDSFAFLQGRRRKFQKAWFALIDQTIAQRRARSAGESHDLLDLLLALRDAETGQGLSPAEIRDQCATMFFAGSETTARLMFWASYLLTQDQDEQVRVRAELEAFAPERVATLADLDNWPRLRDVLFETLRLYPPLPHIMRDSNGPDEISGQAFGANTQVWVSAWIMHRHRKYWDAPLAFRPDRFAGESAPWTKMPAYMPFGYGPRICIGLNFALSEAQIMLGHLLHRYRLTLRSRKPVMPVGRVTIEPSWEPGFSLTAR